MTQIYQWAQYGLSWKISNKGLDHADLLYIANNLILSYIITSFSLLSHKFLQLFPFKFGITSE